MKFEDLSAEMQERVESCESVEELTKLAEVEGIELSDEDLEDIAGGVRRRWKLIPRKHEPSVGDEGSEEE